MKHRFFNRFFFLLLLALLLLGGCMLVPRQPGSSGSDPQAVFTSAAQTVVAQVTLSAGETAVAQLTQMAASPTATQAPQEPTPTPTLPATPEPTATQTSPPPTPVPATPTSPPPTPIPCDLAQFIQDVSIPDGTVFTPNADFIKVWRLKNIGSCTWSTGYAMVFASGDVLSTATNIPMPYNVRPGETVDLAVNMAAPAREGRYKSNWILRNPNGQIFGIGQDGNIPFWVSIRVSAPPDQGFAFDLAANFCLATWRSSAGQLPCPGSSSSDAGSIVLLDRPTLETGRIEDELTLWMRPHKTNGGWIEGNFPAYKVKPGDHFLADIGCLADSQGCDVTFSVDYQLPGGQVRNLGLWGEAYDGRLTRIDIDLSPLTGETVYLILRVTVNSKPSAANAFWLVPSIRAANPPVGENNPAAQAARLRVAQDLSLDLSTVTVRSLQATEWSDSCLGVHLEDQVCTPALVPGYRINLLANGRQVEAHTNQDGTIVFWFEL